MTFNGMARVAKRQTQQPMSLQTTSATRGERALGRTRKMPVHVVATRHQHVARNHDGQQDHLFCRRVPPQIRALYKKSHRRFLWWAH